MSLESGRKLGLAASIIAFVVPIIMVVAYVGFFVALLGSFGSAVTGVAPTTSLWSFSLLGVVIIAGGVGFIGYVLFMVAMYNLSKYYGEPAIFRNLLNALIIGIVGSVVLGVVLVAFVVASAANFVPSATSTGSSFVWSFLALGALLLGLLAIAIYSAVLTRRAFVKLADKSGIDSFRTAGLLLLIGAFIPLIAYVGWIFAAIGYNKLAPNQPQTSYPQYSSAYAGETKRCPNCGTENSADAIYCRNCGKQL